MNRKAVLIVTNYFFPYISGISEYARTLAASLTEDYNVTVLCGKHRPELNETETAPEGYVIVRAAPLFFLDKGIISVDYVSKFRELSNQCDVINLHLPMLESGLFALISKKPLVTTYQCDMAKVGSLLSRLAVSSVQMSMRIALRKSKAIAVLSSDYASSSPLLTQHMAKVHTIHPPNRFALRERAEPTGLSPKGRFVCGFVGRFVLEKGIDVIVEAANQLAGHDIEFWLAGDYEGVAGGSVIADLADSIKQCKSVVRILGKLSDEDLIGFYRQIDVLMLPSVNRFEAFGMVQMEAMLFGAMPIASNMPGVREVVNHTGIGQLCEPNSAQSLAHAIIRARDELTRKSRQEICDIAKESFPIDKFKRQYVKLLFGT